MVLAPLLVIVVSLCLIGGRVVLLRQQLDDIARNASEAASTGASPQAASYAATLTAVANVLADALPCSKLAITPQTADFGPAGSVTVAVSCTVPLSHLTAAGLPGSVTLTATRTALVEPYRQFGP